MADWETAPKTSGGWETASPAPKQSAVASYLKGPLSPLGGLETAASLVSGAVAGPISGLAGIAQLGSNQSRWTDQHRPAGDVVEQVQNSMTYQPRTAAGEGLTKAITYPFVKLAELAEFTGGKTTDLTKSPGAGTVANTALQAIPMMLARTSPAKPAGKTAVTSRYDAGTMAAKEAGYVLPPTQVNPSVWNQIVEGAAGKVKTAQAASLKNQEVTNGLVRKGLGVSDDAPLTVETLEAVRKNAGESYERIRGAGRVTADPVYLQELDAIAAPFERAAKDFPELARKDVIEAVKGARRESFDASSAVDQISSLRKRADKEFRTGDKELGAAYKEISGALEEQLARHLQATGSPAEIISDFRQARERIAKTYTVQKHLDLNTGNVNAQGLAKELKRKPLSGELRTVAEFGSQFPRAAQTPQKVGGIPMSLFDLAMGGLPAAMMLDPTYLALVGARPAVRSAIMSGPYQGAFVKPPGTGQNLFMESQRNPLVPLSEISEGQRSN